MTTIEQYHIVSLYWKLVSVPKSLEVKLHMHINVNDKDLPLKSLDVALLFSRNCLQLQKSQFKKPAKNFNNWHSINQLSCLNLAAQKVTKQYYVFFCYSSDEMFLIEFFSFICANIPSQLKPPSSRNNFTWNSVKVHFNGISFYLRERP